MNLQSAFSSSGIVDEAHFAEAIHEEADSRACGAYHFGERFLIDLGEYGFRNALLAEVSEQCSILNI